MTPHIPLLMDAASEPLSGWGTHLLTALLVPTVLAWLYNAAQRACEVPDDPRVVKLSRQFVWFVVTGWTCAAAIAVLEEMTVKEDDFWPAVATVAMFVALLLPLHLEAFYARVTWDDEGMHTRSPWRGPRYIPFSEVVSCDYSTGMKWYRIHTRDRGTVRLHIYMQGIPQLFVRLPCPTPPYPPPAGSWSPEKGGKG